MFAEIDVGVAPGATDCCVHRFRERLGIDMQGEGLGVGQLLLQVGCFVAAKTGLVVLRELGGCRERHPPAGPAKNGAQDEAQKPAAEHRRAAASGEGAGHVRIPVVLAVAAPIRRGMGRS